MIPIPPPRPTSKPPTSTRTTVESIPNVSEKLWKRAGMTEYVDHGSRCRVWSSDGQAYIRSVDSTTNDDTAVAYAEAQWSSWMIERVSSAWGSGVFACTRRRWLMCIYQPRSVSKNSTCFSQRGFVPFVDVHVCCHARLFTVP